MKKAIVLIAALAAALAWAYAWRGGYLRGDAKIVKRTRFLMDTFCTIQVPNEAGVAKAEAAINRAFDRMAEVDRKFNCTNPESPLYKFNYARVPITDPEVVGLIERSLELSRETDGAFDITVQPLVDLWGFYHTSASSRTVPSPASVRRALSSVGWKRISVKNGVVTADKDVRLDMGSIAKGYAIGETEKALKAEGVRSALILAGGQVQVFGSAAPGVPWKVGVRNPRKEGYIAGLSFDSENGIATAGDYERYFEVDGVRYHHIIDPKTGYPAKGGMSVSVISPDPVLADGLDTPFLVMGQKRTFEFLKKHAGVEVIIIDAKGEIVTSRNAPDETKAR